MVPFLLNMHRFRTSKIQRRIIGLSLTPQQKHSILYPSKKSLDPGTSRFPWFCNSKNGFWETSKLSKNFFTFLPPSPLSWGGEGLFFEIFLAGSWRLSKMVFKCSQNRGLPLSRKTHREFTAEDSFLFPWKESELPF